MIADHLRAVGFLLADGVLPSNEGRGYVLRRILRRASRHGMKLGFEEPFMAPLLPSLEEAFAGHYPELEAAREPSSATVTAEETRFLQTVAVGAGKVQQAIEEARSRGTSVLAGDVTFQLYDTFGLPIETVRDIAEEEQFGIDEAGFEAALAKQRERSRAVNISASTDVVVKLGTLIEAIPPIKFVGYDRLETGARVAIVRTEEGEPVERLAGTGLAAFTGETPFYAEAGGQVGDVGLVKWDGGEARVLDTLKEGALTIHEVEVTQGELQAGADVDLQVDRERRESAQRHHTATHLLHAALRQHLGTGVRQAGSLVHPDRLRFDFTHGAPVTEAQQEAIEDTVNEWVRRAVPVEIAERSHDEAVAAGAMALFGEKYGDRVRTVEVPGFSLELCGGCHVGNTGEIGPVTLVGERGVAAGVRRIEALAGDRAERLHRDRAHLLATLESEIGASGEQATVEVRALKERLRQVERELSKLRLGLLAGDGKPERGQSADGDTRSIGGVDVVLREVPASNVGELRSLADVLRSRLGSGVVVLGALDEGKVKLVASVTQDLQDRVDAAAVARAMGSAISGSGGGRRDFAQAGGRAKNLLPAFAAAERLIEESLG